MVTLPPPSLNAPYGARCFLTYRTMCMLYPGELVLMHLMARGAF